MKEPKTRNPRPESPSAEGDGKKSNYIGMGILFGMLFGLCIGTAMGKQGPGISLGLLVGLLFGTMLQERAKKQPGKTSAPEDGGREDDGT